MMTNKSVVNVLNIKSFNKSFSIKNVSTKPRYTQNRRVVITGIGIISPVGCTTQKAWQNVLSGYCGISKLPCEYDKLPCRIAAQIPKEEFNIEQHFTKSELRTMAPATALALVAGKYQEEKSFNTN
jgi:3-oxoacyl-(acyl-carrier-protein) synthase